MNRHFDQKSSAQTGTLFVAVYTRTAGEVATDSGVRHHWLQNQGRAADF